MLVCRNPPPPQGNQRPHSFHHAKGPCSLQKAIYGCKNTRECKSQDVPAAAWLQGITNHHGCDCKQAEGCEKVHLVVIPSASFMIAITAHQPTPKPTTE